jgi:GNAT superfamily N-acetyltransferase
VLTAQPDFSLLLRPLLEPEGFSPSFKVLRIEWNGGSVTVADPGTIRFERYVGDSQRIDAAVVELHNRSFRAARPKPPISLDRLWMRHASLEHREFVLAVEEDRLVGYAEWRIDAGEAWIANYAVARSHWGTGIAGILCAKAMEAVLQHGHTKMAATIRSTNAAAMRQAQAFGWKIAAELSHTFVREF